MRPILITGATGTLGRAFRRICDERGLASRLTSRAELDITSARSIAAALALASFSSDLVFDGRKGAPYEEHAPPRPLCVYGRTVRAASDATVSPTYVPDLVHACLDLAIDGEAGVWHLANVGATTWEALARSAARLHGYDDDRVVGVPMSALPLRAPRPPFSALGSARGLLLPRLDDALGRYHGARA